MPGLHESDCPPSPSGSGRDRVRVPGARLTVEPLVFLSMLALTLQAPLSTQYIFQRISSELGFSGNRSRGCNKSQGREAALEEVRLGIGDQ
ncbi:hypothetical protein chiPu_0025920 [Chiloscyllium punctatum]|uniref:Uncharacterized protein n=1 Tax=Chiloscyllium punctatum TaxID=137246 RepID=A0A401TGW2_CHIPU|nr:hypothetical protein [Chiloscyllium punctatum]